MLVVPIPESENLIKGQGTKIYFQNTVKHIGAEARFAVDENVTLCRKASIDGSSQSLRSKSIPSNHPVTKALPYSSRHAKLALDMRLATVLAALTTHGCRCEQLCRNLQFATKKKISSKPSKPDAAFPDKQLTWNSSHPLSRLTDK